MSRDCRSQDVRVGINAPTSYFLPLLIYFFVLIVMDHKTFLKQFNIVQIRRLIIKFAQKHGYT